MSFACNISFVHNINYVDKLCNRDRAVECVFGEKTAEFLLGECSLLCTVLGCISCKLIIITVGNIVKFSSLKFKLLSLQM